MTGEQERYNRLMGQLKVELGTDIMAAVIDEAVTDIKVGGDGELIVKYHSRDWQKIGVNLDFDRRVRVLNLIAHELGKTLNEASSELSGELPLTGSRIQGSVPPTSNATLAIRRHSSRLFTLTDYVTAGICTQEQADFLRHCVLSGKNLVVAGGVGSGKTTLTNALLAEIISMEHVVIVEDTAEIRAFPPNCTVLKTSDTRTMRDLLKSCLRLQPDRIVVGETRGPEGYEMLKVWDAGQRGGITTVHADDAQGVLRRFGQFCLEAGVQPQWELIRKVIDVIVYIKMTREGRKITSIMEVNHERIGERVPVELKRIEQEQPRTSPTWGAERSRKNVSQSDESIIGNGHDSAGGGDIYGGKY